jgi:hypothetical protein
MLATTWGSTATERARSFPCDTLLPDPDAALFRAVDVDAPAPLVFRWLCQLRVAPYSYDWLDNGGRRSPRRLTGGLDDLATGQRVMTIFRLASFARDRHLTLTLDQRFWRELFGTAAISYTVVPRGHDRSRIVVKLLIRYPLWGRWRLARRLFALGDLVMMRKQLLTLKALAEGMARRALDTPTGRATPRPSRASESSGNHAQDRSGDQPRPVRGSLHT